MVQVTSLGINELNNIISVTAAIAVVNLFSQKTPHILL